MEWDSFEYEVLKKGKTEFNQFQRHKILSTQIGSR
jgi:hypothetical protein